MFVTMREMPNTTNQFVTYKVLVLNFVYFYKLYKSGGSCLKIFGKPKQQNAFH